MKTENNIIGKLEAMLFASGEPVEAARLAEVLELDVENITKMLSHLADTYDEKNSGIQLIRVDGKYQLCTREAYADDVRKLLEIKKNTPLSQAAFEVLAIVAYNRTVTKSFIEQVRGVDCSGSIANLVQKGLIEEKGRLDLPGRPLVTALLTDFCVASRSTVLMICPIYLNPRKKIKKIRKPPCLMKKKMLQWIRKFLNRGMMTKNDGFNSYCGNSCCYRAYLVSLRHRHDCLR